VVETFSELRLIALTDDVVSVERTVPELTVKASPKAVWYDRFTVDTLFVLTLTALTDDAVSVERTVPELTVKASPKAVW